MAKRNPKPRDLNANAAAVVAEATEDDGRIVITRELVYRENHHSFRVNPEWASQAEEWQLSWSDSPSRGLGS